MPIPHNFITNHSQLIKMRWAHLGVGLKEVGKEGHLIKRKEKSMKYDIIHKLRRSVFGQSLAVSHRLKTNNNNLTWDWCITWYRHVSKQDLSHGTIIFDLMTLILKVDLFLQNFNHGFYLVMVAARQASLPYDNTYMLREGHQMAWWNHLMWVTSVSNF